MQSSLDLVYCINFNTILIKIMLKRLSTNPNIVIRPFHIHQSYLTPTPSDVELSFKSDVERLPSIRLSESVRLKALGTPATIVAVTLPPSIPLYVRRNSLISILGSSSLVSSRIRLFNPFKSLYLDGSVKLFEEFISTETSSFLVSSQVKKSIPRIFRNSSPKSFATLKLDGENDWAILKNEALQVYGGLAISVSKRKIPRRISRNLARTLSLLRRELTGLSSLVNRGFTYLSGRGVAGLVGSGLVVAITVDENDDILINLDNLLAVSINGPQDLQNCAVSRVSRLPREKPILMTKSLRSIRSFQDAIDTLKIFGSCIIKLLAWFTMSLRLWFLGRHKFILIIGPRTVFLQTASSKNYYELNSEFFITNADEIHDAKSGDTSRNYLNLVTLDGDQKPRIRSTDSFVKSNKSE